VKPGPLQILQKVAGWGCSVFGTILAGFVFVKTEPSGVDAVPILIVLVVACALVWFFVPGKVKQQEKEAEATLPAAVMAEVTAPPASTFTVAEQVSHRVAPRRQKRAPHPAARRRGPSFNLRGVHESGEKIGEAAGRAVIGLVGGARRHS
jgi:hypothetical protein